MATPAEKQQNLEIFLGKGVVMVHLDARRPGVRVPDYLKGQEWLRLNFNHAKGRADLAVNEWGVRETLRFNGAWFPVAVPWSAVFAISAPDQAEQPTIFPDDLPEEMVEAALARLQREGYSLEELELNRPQSLWTEKSEKPRPAAKRATKVERMESKRRTPVVPLPAQAGAPSDAAIEPPKSDREIRRGHLRLVK